MRISKTYLFLIITLIVITGFVVFFLNLSSQLDLIRKTQEEQFNTFLSNQLNQEKLFITQQEAYEKTINDMEKYKMMALETKELVATNQRPEISNIVKKWRPFTAYIICSWEGPPELYGSGSGKIEGLDADGNAVILTNKHVLYKEDKAPSECLITFPEITKIYSIKNPKVITVENDLDIAYLQVSDPDPNITRLASSIVKEQICTQEAPTGNEIIALGYPAIGVSGDITVTDGIISGQQNNYYISTVKLDYGNSGGLAVLVDKNCYLGIPTASVTGEIESLAKILKYSAIEESRKSIIE